MNEYKKTQLIIVEGLTGSGKSLMAHFIARQLEQNGIAANWVHEGESPHPVSTEVGSSIDEYMVEARGKWMAFVNQIESLGQVVVVEACFFNNLIEVLLAHNVERPRIIQYGCELQDVVRPLKPALVYLGQSNIVAALKKNFCNRGEGFRDYVIRYATNTPYAKQRGLVGYEGMVAFWRAFVALTDDLFHTYNIRKVMIDTFAGEWHSYEQRALEFLEIPSVTEPTISSDEATRYIGVYKDEQHGHEFSVQYEGEGLTIDLFLNVRTGLIKKTDRVFGAAGWHFEIHFEADDTGYMTMLMIGGKDVDYLSLVGTVAVKVSAVL